jgi:hypothetical protein
MQLVAHGVHDMVLTFDLEETMAANTRDSMTRWFVDSDDGIPTRELIEPACYVHRANPAIKFGVMFDPRRHPQPLRQPSAGDPRAPFSVKTERAAVLIQRAWRIHTTRAIRRKACDPVHCGPVHCGPVHCDPVHCDPVHCDPVHSGTGPFQVMDHIVKRMTQHLRALNDMLDQHPEFDHLDQFVVRRTYLLMVPLLCCLSSRAWWGHHTEELTRLRVTRLMVTGPRADRHGAWACSAAARPGAAPAGLSLAGLSPAGLSPAGLSPGFFPTPGTRPRRGTGRRAEPGGTRWSFARPPGWLGRMLSRHSENSAFGARIRLTKRMSSFRAP